MPLSNYRVLVTGANGFIGKNLIVRLNELPNVSVTTFLRGDDTEQLYSLITQVDGIVHLAGENRPANQDAFLEVNAGLTSEICNAIRRIHKNTGRCIPLVLVSSAQASQSSPYGRSKLAAEQLTYALSQATGNPCVVFRLPGVFGKWSKPNYNSVVATFCYNLARDLPIEIHDPHALVQLVYVDDVVDALLAALVTPVSGYANEVVEPTYAITLSELARQIRAFSDCRTTLISERVGTGLLRALYATYLSYLPEEKFSYTVPKYADSRGVFVEVLKTSDSGQFSFFTANKGVTRGGHYHHTKAEKFLVIKGEALFRFRNLLTGKFVEIHTNGDNPRVVETIPGWSHEVTNIGDVEMIVIIWASENFEREKPDTVPSKV